MPLARFLRAALLTGSALFFAVPSLAAAPAEADQACLACHSQAGLAKTLANGDSLALVVEPDAFARSVHAPLGCAGCHAAVDLAKHPGNATFRASARAQKVAGAQTCRNCHATIFDAYLKSVHGREGAEATPVCADCHSAHGVARASVGSHLRETCLSCHANARETHEKWLPNTARHLESVSCAACHAPGVRKRIDLRLYDAALRGEARGALAEPPDDAKPLDGRGLRAMLQAINAGAADKVTLVGRLEARTAEEAHGLARKEQATRDCAACHRKGAEAFQQVTLSIIGPDGRRLRYEAEPAVLHSPGSIDSMRRFYAPGGTRIQVLDVALALALVGGILAPLGHLALRRLMRRKGKTP